MLKSIRVLLSLMLPSISACTPAGALNYLSGAPDMKIAEDIAYGDHPRQKLDRYAPESPSCRILFVYGGSWRKGNKEMYGFVGAQLAKSGYYVVIPDYRLYPDVMFPSFAEDIALSISFELEQNHDDKLPLVLMGHSAGALVAALLSFDPRYLNSVGVDQSKILALISLAGPHDYFLPSDNPEWTKIFGVNKQMQQNALPVNHVNKNAPQTLILHGEDDKIVTPKSAQSLTEVLRKNKVSATLKTYPNVGHKRLVAAIGAPLHFLAPTLKDINQYLGDICCQPEE